MFYFLSPSFLPLLPQDLSETVSALSRLIREVQDDIANNKDTWNRVFVR